MGLHNSKKLPSIEKYDHINVFFAENLGVQLPSEVSAALSDTEQISDLVILYYKYCTVKYPSREVERQKKICSNAQLIGRVLIADHGINGTLAGTPQAIAQYIDEMHHDQTFEMKAADWKFSTSSRSAGPIFPDLKVTVVKEIINSGGKMPPPPPGTGTCADMSEVGGHLNPTEFHEKIQQHRAKVAKGEADENDLVIIDVRSKAEVAIGHFEGAADPGMRYFSEFPQYVDSNVQNGTLANKTVLMYCTGGIRCETASNYLRLQGCGAEVFQLRGGIHKYLEAYPDGGLFRGKNFVFDKRAVQTSLDGTVVGRCAYCAAPEDEICWARVCTVCKDLVLACPGCRAARREFHCDAHCSLRDCYFFDLAPFSEEELGAQRAQLARLAGEIGTGKGFKNRRKTLRKQIAKIDAHLAGRRGGADGNGAPLNTEQAGRCRGCGCDGCQGGNECWGKYGAKIGAVH